MAKTSKSTQINAGLGKERNVEERVEKYTRKSATRMKKSATWRISAIGKQRRASPAYSSENKETNSRARNEDQGKKNYQ